MSDRVDTTPYEGALDFVDWPEFDELAAAVGETQAMWRRLGMAPRPLPETSVQQLALLQRAHDLEDRATCLTVGHVLAGRDPEEDPTIFGLLTMAAAVERQLTRLTLRKAA